MYYAHSTDKQDKSDWQPLKDHLENVADIASGFSREFSAEQFGYASGLLHDIGKYSPEFQKRLDGTNIRVDHSTAGAKEVRIIYGPFQSRILEYIISRKCRLIFFRPRTLILPGTSSLPSKPFRFLSPLFSF